MRSICVDNLPELLHCSLLLLALQGRKHREIPLSSQIQRGTQGPISDAHLNVLLELEALFPHSPGKHRAYTLHCFYCISL